MTSLILILLIVGAHFSIADNAVTPSSPSSLHAKLKDLSSISTSETLPPEILQRIVLLLVQEINDNAAKLSQMESTVSSLGRDVQSLQLASVNIRENPVPIGFVYTQLPRQPLPNSIWPGVRWFEITGNYSGLFFRAGGGGSALFGSVQEENIPRSITQVSRTNNVQEAVSGTVNIPTSGWSNYLDMGLSTYGQYHNVMRFYSNGGGFEFRPRNTAVRIWTRIA